MNFDIPVLDSGKEDFAFLFIQYFTRKHTNRLNLIPQQHKGEIEASTDVIQDTSLVPGIFSHAWTM
jgi:hypothetical protein